MHCVGLYCIIQQPFTFMWPCCIVTNSFLIKLKGALIFQIYFVKKLHMFRAVPLPIIRSFPLYIRHWYISCSFNDIYQCRMYSGKLLMMGRGTARNMWSFLTKYIWEISAYVDFVKKKQQPYFAEQRSPVGFCNGDLCSLWGTNCTFIYNLHTFQARMCQTRNTVFLK